MAAKLASRAAADRERNIVRDDEGRELVRTLVYSYRPKANGALGLKKCFEWRVKVTQ